MSEYEITRRLRSQPGCQGTSYLVAASQRVNMTSNARYVFQIIFRNVNISSRVVAVV